MRRVRLFLVVGVCAAGVGGVAAQAATQAPHTVRAAVEKWTKTALEIQDSKISLALGQLGTASAQAMAGCKLPQTRAVFANIFDTVGSLLEGYVRNTERGELGLYKLAPRFGSKQNAHRKAYVKQLDAVGTALRHELEDVTAIQHDAGRVNSECSSALAAVDTGLHDLSEDHKTTDAELDTLLARFG
jgi:hypothetical protein